MWDKETAEKPLGRMAGPSLPTATNSAGWPSPRPKRVFLEIGPIRTLVEQGCKSWSAPEEGGHSRRCTAKTGSRTGSRVRERATRRTLLAEELDADLLVIATDVDGVYRMGVAGAGNWGSVTVEEVVEMEARRFDGAEGTRREFATKTGNSGSSVAGRHRPEIVAGPPGQG